MTKETVNLVHRLDDIPKKDFTNILPKEFSVKFIIIHNSSNFSYLTDKFVQT